MADKVAVDNAVVDMGGDIAPDMVVEDEVGRGLVDRIGERYQVKGGGEPECRAPGKAKFSHLSERLPGHFSFPGQIDIVSRCHNQGP